MALQSHDCVLCDHNTMKTLQHLFLLCPLANQFWASIGLTVPAFDNYIDVIISFRRQLDIPFFMEVIILSCWGIWMTRNDLIFRNQHPSLQGCQNTFKKEFALALHRAKNSVVDLMNERIYRHL